MYFESISFRTTILFTTGRRQFYQLFLSINYKATSEDSLTPLLNVKKFRLITSFQWYFLTKSSSKDHKKSYLFIIVFADDLVSLDIRASGPIYVPTH